MEVFDFSMLFQLVLRLYVAVFMRLHVVLNPMLHCPPDNKIWCATYDTMRLDVVHVVCLHRKKGLDHRRLGNRWIINGHFMCFMRILLHTNNPRGVEQ